LLGSENYVTEDGFDKLAKEEFNRSVWEMVDGLPVKYRELILMQYLQGLKFEEIAEVTGIPLGTVKNRIYKARAKLKREIERHGLFD